MKRIWLVRHGESKAQTMEQYSFDADLSDWGVAQAKSLQQALNEKNLTFREVHISPLRRARQTFEALDIDKNISEAKLTKCFFDIRLIEEMSATSYQTLLPYETLPNYATVINEEEWLDPLNERIKKFCDNLVMNEDLCGDILIVCHMGVLSHLVRKFQSYCASSNESLDYYYFHNCSFSILEITDDCQCKVVDVDNVNHLREKKLLR